MTSELSKEVLISHPASDIKTYFSGIVFEISQQIIVNVLRMPLEYKPFA